MSTGKHYGSTDRTERIQELLSLYGNQEVSVAELLCDQHPSEGSAYTVVEPDLSMHPLTYGELKRASERFAAALAELGVCPGTRVATLLGKSIEHLIAVMGIWRLGAVHVPLFTAFARPAIGLRLLGSDARVVICDEQQRPKLAPGEDIPAKPPWRIIVVGPKAEPTDLCFADLLARHEPGFRAARLGGEAPIVQIYTSGTTGRPKGVVVPTIALASFQA